MVFRLVRPISPVTRWIVAWRTKRSSSFFGMEFPLDNSSCPSTERGHILSNGSQHPNAWPSRQGIGYVQAVAIKLYTWHNRDPGQIRASPHLSTNQSVNRLTSYSMLARVRRTYAPADATTHDHRRPTGPNSVFSNHSQRIPSKSFYFAAANISNHFILSTTFNPVHIIISLYMSMPAPFAPRHSRWHALHAKSTI